MKKAKLKLKVRWDKNVVPANEPRKRGLLIELTGTADEKVVERRAMNIALAIDRSGSMGNRNMEAAKEAAIGVVSSLTEMDVLSVVDFDTEVTTLVEGSAMTPKGKAMAINAIGSLSARGGTALGAGWYEAGVCASKVIDRTNIKTGHIVLLSDGEANSGIVDPREFWKHAAELADRGITSSTVGVGPHYSPLQLEALAEGGRGQMHDAEGGAEIVEVIMGELGETRSIVASGVELILRWPSVLRAELMANFDSTNEGNGMVIQLGHLVNGSPRTVPLLIDVPALPLGEVLEIEAIAEGRRLKNNKPLKSVKTTTGLKVVRPDESLGVARDIEVAERIARLWESTTVLDAMRLNERGDFAGAENLVCAVEDCLGSFSEGTSAEHSIKRNIQGAKARVSKQWDGRSKRASMSAARKFSRSEREHRSGSDKDWSDHL